MREGRRKSTDNIRMKIAQIAAKYIARDGVNDFQVVKRKAALQVGINLGKHMPANIEVE